ncbi:hypothetical protein [Terracoccus luteus]|uniref:Uncharacterized protein n=1 Tax=Terracoccus luteus TaxID=53356 RepID=A0A839PW62_9MICO|nr:hypothetical protein [Terracoccus luteus]MBB2987313.1 hypothetical protein [Terracoccus luteus]MCP2172964.1 hypothetical protein [Terracoccus luteus]
MRKITVAVVVAVLGLLAVPGAAQAGQHDRPNSHKPCIECW